MTSLPEAAAAPTTTPVPALSARRTRTRQRLMAAAVAVFAERGVIGASVEEICEAAGFTRGAFYSNFADKDALVLALIEQGIAEEYAAAERAVAELKAQDEGLAPTEAVSRVLGRLNLGGDGDRTSLLAQQELLLYAARVADLRAPYEAFVDACRAQVHALVADALEFAELEFTMPVELALDLLMAAHDHMHQRALFTGRLDPTAMHALIMNLTRPRTPRAVHHDAGTV
ncbi:DNA-binding transcriptional regulator, AcrR family [Microlunatus sagamiharensis]|uniref:DNA-binding transcriptional regulator, AcrR family n=1 Tax=Microlunatus sagamiharensis TaxID=546874 RepID=A0A1H2N8A0_9ACTN|nr:TetR/AcrR family transcriptional regulator [Microlunatus sagamiharensis]SDV01564.1 DNA-binding transcriptional regulator, AcrR family [Microlunatus sagamiharensis]